MSASWIDCCVAHIATIAGVETAAVLRAFAAPFPRGGPPAPPEPASPGSFEALERACAPIEPAQLIEDLSLDVDRAQAELFTRRLRAVDGFLDARPSAPARVLRVGLRMRLAGILRATRPHASRVRALADYYYSHGCRLAHHDADTCSPSYANALATLQWRGVVPGLHHAVLDGRFAEGPTHVNLLQVDPRRIEVRALDCRTRVDAGESFVQTVASEGAVAATSGGFFLYSEPDIAPPSRRHDPVGLLVRDGVVAAPPVFARGALVIDRDGGVAIERIGLDGCILQGHRGWQLRVEGAVNRAHAEVGPARRCMAIVGDRVVAVGIAPQVPLNGAVIPVGDVDVRVGDRVSCTLPPRSVAVATAMAGGPMLGDAGHPAVLTELRHEDFWGTAPPVTFSQDETGDQNLLPRMVVGTRASSLIFAAVDGRNFERALGMTLAGAGALLHALGCERVLNLDGGSSKRMVLEGRTLDLPSTEVVGEGATDPAIRPVYTALCMHRR